MKQKITMEIYHHRSHGCTRLIFTWTLVSSSSPSLIWGPMEQCSHARLGDTSEGSSLSSARGIVRRCLSSCAVKREYSSVESVSSWPEWINLKRRSFNWDLASRIYKTKVASVNCKYPLDFGEMAHALVLISRTVSCSATCKVRSGMPSVNRIHNSLVDTAVSGSTARCFPLAFSLRAVMVR